MRHVAPPGPSADAIRHEATVLARARGLGVVAVVSAHDLPDGGAALATRYVAGGTLVDVARDHGEGAVLAVVAQVATILARLHDAGIVHGRCSADHVVGSGDEVALCGLSGASVAADGERADPAVDTERFAELVRETCAGDSERARRARAAVGGLAVAPPTTNLRVVASELAGLAGVGRARPAAPARVLRPRRTERRHRRRLPTPRLPSSLVSAGPTRQLAATAAAAALAVAVVGGAALTWADDSSSREAHLQQPTPQATEQPDRPTTTAPSASLDAAPPTSEPGVRVWPDPPEPEAVDATASGAVVDHDGVRYEIGDTGDLVVVGDWDCDGEATPSVVRAGDGSVWTFDRWAAEGEVMTARSVGVAPLPLTATVTPEAGGCDVLRVATGDGRDLVFRP